MHASGFGHGIRIGLWELDIFELEQLAYRLRNQGVQTRGQAAQFPLDEGRGKRQQTMHSQNRADAQAGLLEVGVPRLERDIGGQRVVLVAACDEGENDVAVRAERVGQTDRRSSFLRREVVERNGTRTILPRIMERLAVGERVEVLSR